MKLHRVALLAAVPFLFAMDSSLAQTRPNQRSQNNVAQMSPAPGNQGRPERERGPKFLEQLNLSSEQSAQIQSIQERSRTASEGLRQQLQQAHEQMRSLMANGNADSIRQQHQQIQSLKQQLDNQRFETMLQVREILTAEQRAQLATLEQQHQGRHRGGPRPQ